MRDARTRGRQRETGRRVRPSRSARVVTALPATSLQPVSVVVVNHNAGALLTESVRTALAQAAQVIVVDNASTDSSMDLLADRLGGEPRLVVHRGKDNLGFAAGCNVGLRLAEETHVLFLNPDCVLGAGSLQRLVEVLEREPGAGMVGGLLVNPDGSEQGGGRRAMPTPWRSFVRAFGLSRLGRRWPRLFPDFHLQRQPLPDAPVDVEAISGALMLVRRAAIDDVGPWDEAYFLHCEDLDWCMRFRRRGWRILFVPDAPAIHHQGHCSRERPVFVAWHKHRGMARFYRKFYRRQYAAPLMWLVDAGIWLRFALVSLHHLGRRALKRAAGRRG